MPLHDGNFYLRLDGRDLHFRATLGAAVQLEKCYGSFAEIFRRFQGLHLTCMMDVLTATLQTRDDSAYSIVQSLFSRPLAAEASRKLLQFACNVMLALHGYVPTESDPDDAPRPFNAEDIARDDLFRNIYGHALVTLGWAPERVWSATVFEIVEALLFHAEFVEAANARTAGTSAGYNAAPFDEAGLAELAAMARH